MTMKPATARTATGRADPIDPAIRLPPGRAIGHPRLTSTLSWLDGVQGTLSRDA